MKYLYVTFFVLLTLNMCFAQISPSDSNYLSWSSTRKLTVNDFGIKTKNLQTSSSYAQFTMGFGGMFGFMTKNFNKKVYNYFIKSASWIDTTYDINLSIKYQQTLFDICEIYARGLRKDLKANRKKIAWGTATVEELNARAVTTFSHRRIEYDTETRSGTDTEKQLLWEVQIQKELDELKNFSNE